MNTLSPLDLAMRAGGIVLLLMWATAMTLVGVALMVEHWVGIEMPAQQNGDDLLHIVRADDDVQGPVDPRVSRPHESSPEFSVLHVLYASCPCSRRITRHLVERGPITGTDETVVLLGTLPDQERALQSRGFRIRHVTVDDLARLRIEAAPAFVVIDRHAVVRHAGGYTARKQGLDYRDVETIAALRRGDIVRQLPVLGCAMSKALQELLDPLRLKYRGPSGDEANVL